MDITKDPDFGFKVYNMRTRGFRVQGYARGCTFLCYAEWSPNNQKGLVHVSERFRSPEASGSPIST